MRRKAGYVYVEVEWDLTSDDEPTPSMKAAGVTRIVPIPVVEFNSRYAEPPDDWIADYLSDEYDWLVSDWRFA